jgi:hypothetical protein
MAIVAGGVTCGTEFPSAESYDALLGALPQMLCWWVPDASRITKDGSNRVSAWADRAAAGRLGVQATTGRRPLWVPGAAPGGWPVMRFDATRTDAIGTNVVVPTGSSAKFTKVALVKAPAEPVSNTFRTVMAGSSAGDTHRFGVRGTNTLGQRVGGTTSLQSYITYTPDTWTLLMSSWDGVVGRVSTSLNGAPWVQTSTPTPAVVNSDAGLSLGTTTNAANAFTGDIADALLLNVALHIEAADILVVIKQYFRDRYAMSVA